MKLNITPTDMHALARLIRRYESGGCTETQLTGRLQDVLNGLQARGLNRRIEIRIFFSTPGENR